MKPIPKVESRRPYDEVNLPGYEESDNDFMGNNSEFVLWALAHENQIRSAFLLAKCVVEHQYNPGAVAPYMAYLATKTLKDS